MKTMVDSCRIVQGNSLKEWLMDDVIEEVGNTIARMADVDDSLPDHDQQIFCTELRARVKA